MAFKPRDCGLIEINKTEKFSSIYSTTTTTSFYYQIEKGKKVKLYNIIY